MASHSLITTSLLSVSPSTCKKGAKRAQKGRRRVGTRNACPNNRSWCSVIISIRRRLSAPTFAIRSVMPPTITRFGQAPDWLPSNRSPTQAAASLKKVPCILWVQITSCIWMPQSPWGPPRVEFAVHLPDVKQSAVPVWASEWIAQSHFHSNCMRRDKHLLSNVFSDGSQSLVSTIRLYVKGLMQPSFIR